MIRSGEPMEGDRASELETDYLVIGAGASGMAFVDTLLRESGDEVIMVDRRDRPGGHWLDAYPFVKLHQPAACYGVASVELGGGRIDLEGPNRGMYELSSSFEICNYFSDALNRVMLPTGRLRFLGMTDFREDASGDYVLTSSLTGKTTRVLVRKRLVDARYIAPDIPSLSPPGFPVDDEVNLVSPNQLVNLAQAPAGFTIIGAGKTALDVTTWLLENGVEPDSISWIRPRDAWYIDRSWTQPLDLVDTRVRYQATWAEAAAKSSTGAEMALVLEDAGAFHRLDKDVEPTAYRGATINQAELEGFRAITRVVRQGYVRGIAADGITLDGGYESRPAGEIYVNCTASGIRTTTPRPVFEAGKMTIQYVTPGLACFSAATLALVEARRDDDEVKNYLSLPVVYSGRADDLLQFTSASYASEARRRAEPDLAAWERGCRLNPLRGLEDRRDRPGIKVELERLGRWANIARDKVPQFGT